MAKLTLVTPFFLLLPFPSVLYPNLAELENYMGLSLSSQEVQQNLPQSPDGTSVGICLLPKVGTDLPTLPPSWSRLCNILAALFLDGTFHFEPSLQVLWDFMGSPGPWGCRATACPLTPGCRLLKEREDSKPSLRLGASREGLPVA